MLAMGGLNLNAELESIALSAARDALMEKEQRDRERSEFQLIFESDIALALWEKSARRHGAPPCLRASSYHGEKIAESRELLSWQFRDDPRRPVAMRAAKDILIAKYNPRSPSCGNGWAARVVERYLRVTKYTCFEDKQHAETMERIRLWARKFYISYHFGGEKFFQFVGISELYGDAHYWFHGKYFHCREIAEYKELRAQHDEHLQRAARRAASPTRARHLNRNDLDREARILSRALYELGLIQPGETL